MKELLETPAEALNYNIEISFNVDAKSVGDRYERLQRVFVEKDRKDTMMLGKSGEVTETYKLLSSMREAQ